MKREKVPPTVLVIAGNDPSGGAGIAADIQAVTAMGAHPAPVLTALTVQDTHNASAVRPLDADFVIAQARAVVEDLDVAVVKVGLLASAAVGEAVAALLAELGRPAVIDPVLVAAGGARLSEDALVDVIRHRLAPLATLLTPNAGEVRALVPEHDTDERRAASLVADGAGAVLVKGADEDTPEVHNVLYDAGGESAVYTWSRLPHHYHGSGCTLASATAALMARGSSVEEAVAAAQRYTWEALRRGFQPGSGQHIGHRFFHLPETPR